MAEDKKERILEPEGLEKNFIEFSRYDESKEWVEKNNQPIYQRLLNRRSLWQRVVDWGHQRPITYAVIVTSASLLIIGGVLLSIFLGGMPLLMLIGLSLIIPPMLPAIDIARHKTSGQPMNDFLSALRCQYAHTYTNEYRKNELTSALSQMGQSMRTEAEAIVTEQKNLFADKKYDVPLGIQAKEKMRKIVQGIPKEFPLSNDFTSPHMGRCHVSGETKDTLCFRASYSSTFSSTLGDEQTSENAVKFFIEFLKEVLGIQAECKRGEETDFSRGVSGLVSGSYYCDITKENVTKIVEADISKAEIKAKQFYENWEAGIRPEPSIISALDEWAKNDEKCQETVKEIKNNLKFTQSTVGGDLEGTCRIHFQSIHQERIESRNARYCTLQNYLNDKFGKNTCQLVDNSTEEQRLEGNQGTRAAHVDIRLSIKLPTTTTRSPENKPDLTGSAPSTSFKN